MECGQKIRYQNKSLADEACRKLIADNRQTRKIGKSWKRLNTYRCHQCGYWHIGRHNKLPKDFRPLPPPKKVPSAGEIRRRVERLEKHLDRERRQRAYLIGKVVELDRQQAALEKERRECVLAIERMFLGE